MLVPLERIVSSALRCGYLQPFSRYAISIFQKYLKKLLFDVRIWVKSCGRKIGKKLETLYASIQWKPGVSNSF